jgi:UDP:flavonoid glycosyltransferase YjiC (YdhE family)
MRVLISSVAGYGHLQPMLPLATALSAAGHEVAIAVGPELLPRAEAAGFVAFASGIGPAEAFPRLAQRFPDQAYNRLQPAEILGWYLPHLFAEVMASAMLADLELIVHRWRPDVVVHDSWEFAAPIAAAGAGIASVSHTLGLRHDHRTLREVGAAVAPLWRQRGLDPDPAAGIYRHLCLDITPPSLQRYQAGHIRTRLQPLRPIAPPALRGETLPAWLSHGRRRDMPLVYMTLGTNTNSDVSMFRSVIDGLSDVDVEVQITIGHDKDLGSVGLLPANAHVDNYVPQALLLPHCDAVICHGGAGTTLNSLALGLPLLILPQGADQYVIGGLVATAGAGLVLAPAEVSPSSVRANVLALLNDGAERASARRLQAEIAAMPGPDQAVHLIETVWRSGGRPSVLAYPAWTSA